MFEKEKYESVNPNQYVHHEPPTGENLGDEIYGSERAVAPSQYATGLILGKFKSIDDLSKAYLELQRKFGAQAQEIGELRKLAEEYTAHKEQCNIGRERLNGFYDYVKELHGKYNNEKYLKNPKFREIFKTAYAALGNNLDVDSLIRMLEGYNSSRNSLSQIDDAIKSETDSATDMLAYSNGPSKFKSSTKKRLTDMTPEELNKALDELM